MKTIFYYKTELKSEIKTGPEHFLTEFLGNLTISFSLRLQNKIKFDKSSVFKSPDNNSNTSSILADFQEVRWNVVVRQLSLIRVCNVSCAWRKLGSLVTHWAHREDWSDWADVSCSRIKKQPTNQWPFDLKWHLALYHWATALLWIEIMLVATLVRVPTNYRK